MNYLFIFMVAASLLRHCSCGIMTGTDIFVYGTLKKLQPNYHHMTNLSLGNASFVGHFRSQSIWPLVILTEANLPCLLPLEGFGKQIIGEVYRVDSKMLAFLDEFEGHPTDYVRKEILVEPLDPRGSSDVTTDGTLRCWCYFFNLNVTKDSELLRDAHFLDNYDSYGDHGKSYISEADDERVDFVR